MATKDCTVDDADTVTDITLDVDSVSAPAAKEPAAKEPARKKRAKEEPAQEEPAAAPLSRRAVVRVVAAVLAVVAVLAVIGGLGWKVHSLSGDADAAKAAAAGRAHAEKVALDYAAGASQIDYTDQNGWIERLTKGTSPDLANRLKQAASSMEPIIVPLQWVSTSQPIIATTKSEAGGVYQVYCFVSLSTKSTQVPEGIESTATYTVSVDANDGWKITDVGGVGAALGLPNAPK